MKPKILPRDYREELANIAEQRNFGQDAENLLLSMVYKIEDSYDNYKAVKREVPEKHEFIEAIVSSVQNACSEIVIAEPKSKLEKELQANKVKVMTENEKNVTSKRVISYPNEKTLLYGITKAALRPIRSNSSNEEKAVLTAIDIGKCISVSEVVRDFNGWSWSILDREIESTECNVIYIFLSLLLGYKFADQMSYEQIKKNISPALYKEIEKVAKQFYMSYDKDENERVLKKLAEDKKRLEEMKDQAAYVLQISDARRVYTGEINRIDKVLNDQATLKKKYLEYNSKLPDEKKVFSVSHYADMLEKKKSEIMKKIENLNKMQNPIKFVEEKDALIYEIKLYEEKTDITGLEKAFLKMYEEKLEKITDRRDLIDYIYKVRYLNHLPNCKMNLKPIMEKLIPFAIRTDIIAPVSNNDDIDYRLLKGIFDSQVVNLESLYIKLSSSENKLHVEIYDGDILDQEYDVVLPEGSQIEIKKSRKTKIFE